MTVGVLAFQGDFSDHLAVLERLKVQTKEVRTLEDLKNVDRLIIPGGESTVMGMYLEESGLLKEIQKRHRKKTLPMFGTCAGIILLAKKVRGKNAPHSLGLLNVDLERNAYGTQMQSFDVSVIVPELGKAPIRTSFIRAPKILKVRRKVLVMATVQKNPVLVRQGSLLAATFHTEVNDDTRLHEYFLRMKS